jgi:hypothetical protein
LIFLFAVWLVVLTRTNKLQMGDIIANILARLAALEQAVGVSEPARTDLAPLEQAVAVAQPARTDGRPRRRLPTVAVARRYDVVPRTIDRWAEDPELDFPPPEVINRRRYWDEDALDGWDQARIRSSWSRGKQSRLTPPSPPAVEESPFVHASPVRPHCAMGDQLTKTEASPVASTDDFDAKAIPRSTPLAVGPASEVRVKPRNQATGRMP